MNRLARFFLLIFLCLALMLPAGCAQQSAQKYSMSFFGTFDTVITILGYADSRQQFDQVTQQAQALYTRYHQLYDTYHAYPDLNNIHTVNQQAAKGPVKVPKELFDLLVYCKQMQPKLHNTVNIAMGSVLALWHEAREAFETDPQTAQLPDLQALKAAARHTGFDQIVLNEADQSVFIKDPGLRLDLGAIAKGYATELVAQYMLKSPMPSFIINAGGNVRAGHSPKNGRLDWGIAIQDPDGSVLSDANSDVMDVLFSHDVSVVTSGDYQRYFLYEGKRYHHIISPQTLAPSDYMRSVTVITQDSGYADLLSTALFLMPYEQGRAFVDTLPGVGAVWILNDRSVQMTPNAMQMAKSHGADAH